MTINCKKNIYKECILHTVILILLFGTTFYILQYVNIQTDIGYEDVYWERARFLCGQKGASTYNNSSLISLGYSFVLLPICLFVQSPFAAYKVAILLNCCFLCASYAVSFKTIRIWFKNESSLLLAFACLITILCPVFVISRIYSRPDTLIMFLIWMTLYFLTSLWSSYSRIKLIGLTVCLILIPFLNIVLFGVVGAVIIILYFFVKEEKLHELSFFRVLVALLLGLVFEGLIEHLVLWSFFKGQEKTFVTSFLLLWKHFESGWENRGFIGLLSTIFAKLFGIISGSFLLVCPGFLFSLKRLLAFGKRRAYDVLDMACLCLCLMFLFQIIIGSLCDNSGSVSSWLVSLRNLDVVLPAFIVIGFVYVKHKRMNVSLLAGIVFMFCFCAYVTAGVYQEQEITSISAIHSCILTIFNKEGMSIVFLVYYTACVVILAGIILIGLWSVRLHNRLTVMAMQFAGAVVLLILYCGASVQIFQKTAAKASDEMSIHVSAAASLLSETDGNYYYLKGTGNDNAIVVLQSLIPERKIHLVESDEQELNVILADSVSQDKDAVLITGTDYTVRRRMKEQVPQYRLLYMTDYYALWAKPESNSGQIIQEGVERRIETPVLNTKTDDEISYRGNASLAVGTYRVEVYLKLADSIETTEAVAGLFRVSDTSGTIQTKDFDISDFDENGNAALALEFTRKNIIQSPTFTVEGEIARYLQMEDIYYWQISSAYTVGQNEKDRVAEACSRIAELDSVCGLQGRILYIEDVLNEYEIVSVACFEEFLTGYEISVETRENVGAADTEYLITDTANHAYFSVMDQYSVIYRDRSFTVLVRNGTQQYEECLENGQLMSEGTCLLMSAFSKVNPKYKKRIRLELGTYCYHFDISFDQNDLHGDDYAVAGTLLLYNGDKLITQKTIRNSDARRGTLDVPFALRSSAGRIRYVVELESAKNLNVTQKSIEIISQKYQYGMEEEKFQELAQIVNGLGNDISLTVVQSENVIQTEKNEYSYLQELVPNCEVYVETYNNIKASCEDGLLIVHGLTDESLRLLENFSILGHAGQYTLMVRNNGQLLSEAIGSGITVLNSGKKLSMDSIASMSATVARSSVIEKLPGAKYSVVIELDLTELSPDDVIELSLICDKSENDITKEQEALLETGYTEEEAARMIELQKVCGSASYDLNEYCESEKILVSVSISSSQEITNLRLDGYTWQGAELKGKIVWIEFT